ncbi:MAG: gliding motility-associated C-terminal domain-containing protein [Cyclobacteriaceae bacterium]|nr:gliding motility-associated C-terminal domain-containing protein [Cyclobacteriaceae bacterium]
MSYRSCFTRGVASMLVALFVSATPLLAQNQTAKITPTSQIGYYEYLPPDYNSNSNNYPIVIFFHGIGERGNGTTDLPLVTANGPPRYVVQGYQFPFILISPQLKSNFGTWPVWYMDEVVEHVRSYLRVDPTRIYITGLSLGGGGAWEYVYNFPQKVAALAPICGGYNTLSWACTYRTNNIPIWAFHGDADSVVPISRTTNMINAINACTPAIIPTPIYTIYQGVWHDAWNYAYRTDNSLHTPNVYEWMMQQVKQGISVSAGPDKTIALPTTSTTLNGLASTTTGSITSYSWTKVSGPAVTMTNTNTPNLSLSNMVVGVYTFRLTATNSAAQSAFDDIKVTVLGSNQNPVANAGPDITIKLPTNSLNLIGSGSDPDGSIATYLWTKVSGPSATLTGASTPTLSLSNLVQGNYVFRLTVTDNIGATASDEVNVAVTVNQPPTGHTGGNKTIFLPTNSVTLFGWGSDPDGWVASYLWEKLSGPPATLTNANTQTLTLSNLVAGTYVVRITATDNSGATGSEEATVTVVGSNQSPIANAGTNITLTLPTNSTNIVGSGSDPDGSITSYLWTQVNGPNTATITNGSSPTVTVSNLVQGVYTFRLTVTDNNGATGFANVTVTVNAAPVNNPPLANAGPDRSITLPTNSIVINGSGTDSDGTITAFSWTKQSGPAATLADQSTANLTASGLVEGTYVFRLTVTDNQGATGQSQMTLTVLPAAINQSPIVNAGADVSLTLPSNSTILQATASDPDGSIASYQWQKISGPIFAGTGNTTANFSLNDLQVGTYVFRITVTDNQGATASDEVSVFVFAANQPPLVSAPADQTITLPTSTTILTAVATDADGTIASYLWTYISGPASPTLSGATTASLTASNLIQGTYTFRITVTDDDGATAFDEVNVVVQSATNQSPIANAGPNKSITLPTNSTNFTGSGVDPDGTIAGYAWVQISGTAATLTNANTATLTVQVPSDGIYIFRLTVTDNIGATGSSNVTLTVNPAAVNQPPIASAGANQTLTLPVNSTNLNGSGSDPDGSIASYLWTQLSGPAATLTNASFPTASVSNLVEGVYVFRLTVTDNEGLTAFAQTTVTVLPAAVNQPPQAFAGPDQVLTLPVNSTTLFGSGSDADGIVVSYLWTKQSGPAATLTNATTATLSIADMLEGVYVLRLTVTDDKGATSNDDVTVTVNAASVNQPPIADAGPNLIITLPTNSANINGSGSDADGSVTAYLWAKVSGPTVTLGTLTNPTLSVSNLVEGIYVFRLQVTDNSGATATDDMTLTVNPASVNQAPIVSAGPDRTIFLPINTIQLSGSASDPDGSIVTRLWTQISGPVGAVLVNTNSTLLTVNNLVEGVYRFRFTATDNLSATGSADALVTVNAATVNQAPFANAGANQTIKLPINSITLNGSGNDPDGTIASYDWVKLSGPSCTLANQNTPSLSVTNMLEGTYQFRLTVTDNLGATGSSQVTVTVLPATTNLPPTVSAGGNINVVLPTTTATLTGSATDDGSIATVLWTKLSGPAATMNGTATTTLSLSNLVEGNYVFQLTATDNEGLTNSANAAVNVFTAQPTNLPPVVDAGGDRMIQLPVNAIKITANASDPDGIISSYLWTQNAGSLVTIDPNDTTFLDLTDLVPGTYQFTVTVTDGEGLSANDVVNLQVREEDPVVKPTNTFSPDGKGDIKTETWHITNADLLDDCTVEVFNRQGQKVYSSKGYTTEWNGTFNGSLLPQGAYFYVIRCPAKKPINGSVTLIR